MSKIDLMPEFRANLPRTGHNLSHDLAFTATTAHLLPVFTDFVNAGETVTLGFDFNLRTQPLEAAAMSKIKCHTEYFFVPMQLLYQGFSDWYYGIREEFSSRFSVNGDLADFKLPVIDLGNLFSTLYTNRSSVTLGSGNQKVYPGESIGQSAYRLFDMFGIRPQKIANGNTDKSLGSIFPYQVLAYNCIYQYYYRLDSRERFQPNSFNVDYYFNSNVISYTDFAKYCLLHRRPCDSDYFKDVKVSPIVDVLNLNNKAQLTAATDFLTRKFQVHDGSIGSWSPNVNPFDTSIGASQSIRTQFGFTSDEQDQTKLNTDVNLSVGENGEYLNDEEDPSYAANGNAYFGVTGNLVDSDQFTIKHSHGLSGDVDVYLPGNYLDIGTANIRAMFASEKLWSVTGRAKKNYDDQTLAHFGYKVQHDPKHQISCFGHDVADISIGEVISTSNTSSGGSGSPLGEIAGKGYGAQGNRRHKFTAPCHGVIMAIFSIVPEIYYEGTFGKWNKLSARDDLYTPEYDHLGMQPLFGYESSFSAAQEDPAQILGWQYRYEQWKRRYNRCTSIFSTQSGGSLSSWFHSEKPYHASDSTGSLDSANTASFEAFLHRPNQLNDLFLYGYVTQWSEAFESAPYAIYEGDPFVISSHVDCVKVSTMSDYSLPRLDA